jgi:hypothetical protein
MGPRVLINGIWYKTILGRPGVTQASPLVRYLAPWACGAPNTSPVLGLTMCSRPHAVQVTRS